MENCNPFPSFLVWWGFTSVLLCPGPAGRKLHSPRRGGAEQVLLGVETTVR
jgi:hypothetical protein